MLYIVQQWNPMASEEYWIKFKFDNRSFAIGYKFQYKRMLFSCGWVLLWHLLLALFFIIIGCLSHNRKQCFIADFTLQ